MTLSEIIALLDGGKEFNDLVYVAKHFTKQDLIDALKELLDGDK